MTIAFWTSKLLRLNRLCAPMVAGDTQAFVKSHDPPYQYAHEIMSAKDSTN